MATDLDDIAVLLKDIIMLMGKLFFLNYLIASDSVIKSHVTDIKLKQDILRHMNDANDAVTEIMLKHMGASKKDLIKMKKRIERQKEILEGYA